MMFASMPCPGKWTHLCVYAEELVSDTASNTDLVISLVLICDHDPCIYQMHPSNMCTTAVAGRNFWISESKKAVPERTALMDVNKTRR